MLCLLPRQNKAGPEASQLPPVVLLQVGVGVPGLHVGIVGWAGPLSSLHVMEHEASHALRGLHGLGWLSPQSRCLSPSTRRGPGWAAAATRVCHKCLAWVTGVKAVVVMYAAVHWWLASHTLMLLLESFHPVLENRPE